MISEVFAPAKINLTLHVTGQRGDGYHLLDSLVAFADVGDRLTFTPADALSLKVTGPFGDGVPEDARNLVWQAAELAELSAHITLEKNLPHGAGIGGGSSDAAAVLRHAGSCGAAASLGADVPVCLTPQVQRMQGIGDLLTPLPALPPVWAVLVNPKVHVPTPDVFKALTQKTHPPMSTHIPAFVDVAGLINWLSDMRNDLEPPALACAPQVADVLNAVAACPDVALARMSGSGATCFGLCHTSRAAQDAATTLRVAHPAWWVQPCRLS